MSGWYFVKFKSGTAPVWLTSINGVLYNYLSSQEKWETVEAENIICQVAVPYHPPIPVDTQE